jgi:hypothetical protein
MLDFVLWPELRNSVLSTPQVQLNTKWLIDLLKHSECHWSFDLQEALCVDKETGSTVLTDQAKVLVEDVQSCQSGVPC